MIFFYYLLNFNLFLFYLQNAFVSGAGFFTVANLLLCINLNKNVLIINSNLSDSNSELLNGTIFVVKYLFIVLQSL